MKQIKTIIAIAVFSVISFMQVNAADTTTLNPALPVELKYAGTFKNQPLIQLNSDDLGDAVLKFEITGKKSGKTVSYQVNRNVTEQMNVVKL